MVEENMKSWKSNHVQLKIMYVSFSKIAGSFV